MKCSTLCVNLSHLPRLPRSPAGTLQAALAAAACQKASFLSAAKRVSEVPPVPRQLEAGGNCYTIGNHPTCYTTGNQPTATPACSTIYPMQDAEEPERAVSGMYVLPCIVVCIGMYCASNWSVL